jgi:hypothetical protein
MHVQSTGSGKKEVTGANVLVAIFGEKDSHAVYYLHQQGVTRLDVVNFIAHGIKKSDPPETPKGAESAPSSEGEEGSGEKNEKASPLEQFTQNLNQLAKDGKIDPLIGREHEVERVIQILCRRRKNNPLLVGEAGVGKTAIAEGLAWRITQKDVPEILADSNVFSLDEQNRIGLVLEALEHALEALLEVAAVLSAGQQRAHVQRIDIGLGQNFGNVALDDVAGQAFGNGRLADASAAESKEMAKPLVNVTSEADSDSAEASTDRTTPRDSATSCAASASAAVSA